MEYRTCGSMVLSGSQTTIVRYDRGSTMVRLYHIAEVADDLDTALPLNPKEWGFSRPPVHGRCPLQRWLWRVMFRQFSIYTNISSVQGTDPFTCAMCARLYECCYVHLMTISSSIRRQVRQADCLCRVLRRLSSCPVGPSLSLADILYCVPALPGNCAGWKYWNRFETHDALDCKTLDETLEKLVFLLML